MIKALRNAYLRKTNGVSSEGEVDTERPICDSKDNTESIDKQNVDNKAENDSTRGRNKMGPSCKKCLTYDEPKDSTTMDMALKEEKAKDSIAFLKKYSKVGFNEAFAYDNREFDGNIRNYKMYKRYKRYCLNHVYNVRRGIVGTNNNACWLTTLFCRKCNWVHDCFPSYQRRSISFGKHMCYMCAMESKYTLPRTDDYKLLLRDEFEKMESITKNNRYAKYDHLSSFSN